MNDISPAGLAVVARDAILVNRERISLPFFLYHPTNWRLR
jgi:hypothetical protein